MTMCTKGKRIMPLDNKVNIDDLLEYDPYTDTYVIRKDLKLKVDGDIVIKAEGNIIFNSRFDKIDERTGLPFSLFINQLLDKNNIPQVEIKKRKYIPYKEQDRTRILMQKMKRKCSKCK